jgi:hypothetical protein
VSWSGIAQVESGRRTNVRPGTLSALAAALGVSVDYLVNGSAQAPQMLEHRLLFYGDDAEFVEFAAPFAAAGVDHEEPVLVVTTPARTRATRKALGSRADRVDWLAARDLYTKPAAALRRVDSYFRDNVVEGASWVRILTDPVWAARTRAAARQWGVYEALTNAELAAAPLTLVCAYDERVTPPWTEENARATHPGIIDGGRAESNPDYVDSGSFLLAK